jgi:hypothetical protein
MDFDYEAAETDDDDKVRAVAAEMSGTALKPLTPEELQQRAAWRAELHERTQQERIAAEQHRLEGERQQAEVAQREAAIAAKAERDRAQHVRSEQIGRMVRDRTLSDLRLHAAGQERRQRELDNAIRQSARQQYSQTIMGELEQMIAAKAPPEPEPVALEDEPGSVFGSADFNIEAWSRKRRSWW